jgi:hypothetical protein
VNDQDGYARLSATELRRRCGEETERFLHGRPFDERACVEIFRRAVCDGDQECWEHLHEIYGEQVQNWCRRARNAPAADHEELAAVAWERFWHGFTPARFAQAAGIKAMLAYLRACAWSASADDARAAQWTISLDQPPPGEVADAPPVSERLRSDDATPAEALESASDHAALWQIIAAHLRDPRERTLMRLTLVFDLKPREIQARRPDLFPDVKLVYSMTRNVFDRLRRSPALQRWLAERDS